MNKVVFAGPSIHGLALKSSRALTILPPAVCGDILRAVRAGARVIGLVDGLFGSERSVWHKEILVALSEGVRVLGAASMGALRAAECDRFGMEGIGKIYAEYRDGLRKDDADVALLHGPPGIGYQPLTLALVDAEASIDALSARNLIAPDEAQRLSMAARNLHFSRRTWRAIAQEAELSQQGSAWLCQAAETFKVERKKADALTLIERVRRRRIAGSGCRDWVLNNTLFLAAQEESINETLDLSHPAASAAR